METARRRCVCYFPTEAEVSDSLISMEFPKPPSDQCRDVLPSISYLDIEKIKREDYNHRVSTSATINMPAPSLVSPSTMYPGPPPPYSYPSSTASSVAGITGYISPPESRRTSDDDNEIPLQRQSLPSIQEALGSDQSILYSAPPQTATLPPTSHPTTVQTPTTPAAPRSHPEAAPSGPPNPYASSQSTSHSFEQPERRAQPTYRRPSDPEDTSSVRPPPNPPRDSAPRPSHPTTTTSPTPSVRSHPPPMSQQYTTTIYPPVSQSSMSMAPQPVYSPYQTAYSYPPMSANILSYPQQYVQPPAWRVDGFDVDQVEESRKAIPKRSPASGQHYGESVKRHLDNFELETSLNEVPPPSQAALTYPANSLFQIAEGAGRALDFSRHFGATAHQTQRSGPVPGSLPTLAECDELIRRQSRVLESMTRLRDVIVKQQVLAEQRTRDEVSKASSEYGDDGHAYLDKLDGSVNGSGGFAGGDPKKRRGVSSILSGFGSQRKIDREKSLLTLTPIKRNAPPGRCHSCNRAETPEWRRGPDGARTLCNACGLRTFFSPSSFFLFV